jgi:hypothetical protein
LQVPIVQVPISQPGVAFGTLHGEPQPPQFFGSLDGCDSQPFDAMPSQLEKPSLQASKSQAPAVQRGFALRTAHAVQLEVAHP